MLEYELNINYYLELTMLDNDGEFVNGLDITYQVVNSKTETEVYSGTMVDMGNIYKSDQLIKFSSAGQYRVIYNTPESYENGSEVIIARSLQRGNIIHHTDADGVWSNTEKMNLLDKVNANYKLLKKIDNNVIAVSEMIDQATKNSKEMLNKSLTSSQDLKLKLNEIKHYIDNVRLLMKKKADTKDILNELDKLHNLYIKSLSDEQLEEMVIDGK